MSITVTVKCACGKTFQREQKKGRPQVWCPDCRSVSFDKRAKGTAAVVAVVEPVVEADESEPTVDLVQAARERIEEGMIPINAAYKASITAAIARGVNVFDAQAEASVVYKDATKALYAANKVKVPKDA